MYFDDHITMDCIIIESIIIYYSKQLLNLLLDFSKVLKLISFKIANILNTVISYLWQLT